MNNDILKGFIVIEGLDGSGTTTLLKNMSDFLFAKKIKHIKTFEPTDKKTGGFLRKVLSGNILLEEETIAYLFAADRNEHIYGKDEGIIKLLQSHDFIICDRYLFSSIAYQSIGADPHLVVELNSHFPLPEYLIFLDVPVEECQHRLKKRNTQKEIYDALEIQKKVLENFNNSIDLFGDSKMKVLRVDGTQSPRAISNIIKKRIFSPIIEM